VTPGAGRRLRGAPCRLALLSGVALAVLGCGRAAPLAPPAVEEPPRAQVTEARPAPLDPTGELVVAVPAEPTAWIVPEGDDVAAADLAAVWGLPLYRLDAAGRVVRALAVADEVSADGRSVTIDLGSGSWSDGTPVVADDVVATVEALRDTALGHELDVVAAVVAEGPQRVRFDLEQPTVRWPLLLGPTGVLPAHVLREGGLDAAARLEVTGGPFRLGEHEPGLGATFAAHERSPLGPPGLAELQVRYVPSYDVALELLGDRRLDVALGYLAVGAVRRADRLGLAAAAPVGGTWVALRWRDGGDVPAEQRRAVAGIVDVSEQVEGLALGEELSVPFLAGRGEVDAPSAGLQGALEEVDAVDATLVVRADEELLTLGGRLLEAQVRAREGRLQLRRERTPADVAVAREVGASLLVRRDPVRPDLARDLDASAHPAARAADAAPAVTDPAVAEALGSWFDEARVLPLYRPLVAHVWRREIVGMEPSAWPGLGFSSVTRWQFDGAR
jgi:hypothetical protein